MQRHSLPAALHRSDINPIPPPDNEQANSSFPCLRSNWAGQKHCVMAKSSERSISTALTAPPPHPSTALVLAGLQKRGRRRGVPSPGTVAYHPETTAGKDHTSIAQTSPLSFLPASGCCLVSSPSTVSLLLAL